MYMLGKSHTCAASNSFSQDNAASSRGLMKGLARTACVFTTWSSSSAYTWCEANRKTATQLLESLTGSCVDPGRMQIDVSGTLNVMS